LMNDHQRASKLKRRRCARSVFGASLAAAVILVSAAHAGSPAVTDFSNVEISIIESGDIAEALAVPRGTKVGAAGRPRVRLPVYFEFGSARLVPEAEKLLVKVGKALSTPDLETLSFSIEGHTDSSGDESFNQDLSLRRARAVEKFLEDAGVSAGRLQSVGHGEASPVDVNSTMDGRKRNRRVEIVNLGAPS